MKITIEYAAQVKRAAGIGSEEFDFDSPCSVQAAVTQAAKNHGDELWGVLFHSDGRLHPSILLFVGDNQVRWDQEFELSDHDVITLLSPISGG